jgi:tRNA pseudouridine55 synthase
LRQGQPVMTSDRPLDGWVSIYEASTDTFMGVGEVLEDGRIAPRRLVSG